MLRQITLILFGLALSITLFVEVFVLKGDVGRSNTVFYFYNQAWFIFGLAASLALLDLLSGLLTLVTFDQISLEFVAGGVDSVCRQLSINCDKRENDRSLARYPESAACSGWRYVYAGRYHQSQSCDIQ